MDGRLACAKSRKKAVSSRPQRPLVSTATAEDINMRAPATAARFLHIALRSTAAGIAAQTHLRQAGYRSRLLRANPAKTWSSFVRRARPWRAAAGMATSRLAVGPLAKNIEARDVVKQNREQKTA